MDWRDKREVKIGKHFIGKNHSTYVIGEIGINHNGSLELAKKLMEGAQRAGCNAVKFQKRTPEICVPKDQWEIERETPWGRMTYLEYRDRMEFSESDYWEIDTYAKKLGIDWFASCWDVPSVEFIEQFKPVAYKVASASVTDLELLHRLRQTERPIILSTGMSSMLEVETAVHVLGQEGLLIAHSTSAYPCKPEELNLNVIGTLAARYPRVPIGYSGHETGIIPSCTAVALGACFVERHITLDRAMWGTDQAASLEMGGLERMVNYFRDIETALGNGIKQVYDSELAPREKLRRVRPDRELNFTSSQEAQNQLAV